MESSSSYAWVRDVVEVELSLCCVSAITLGPGCVPVSWLGSS